jgi:hypothetical protein
MGNRMGLILNFGFWPSPGGGLTSLFGHFCSGFLTINCLTELEGRLFATASFLTSWSIASSATKTIWDAMKLVINFVEAPSHPAPFRGSVLRSFGHCRPSFGWS